MQLLYGLQWVAFHLGIIITVPVVVGSALNLDPAGIASLTQRVFFLAGFVSLLQVIIGHRMLLVEGPAAPWWAAYVILAALASQIGGDIAKLRTDLEGAMLVVGTFIMLAGIFGLIQRILPLFTPAIKGTVLMLLALQIGGIGVKGMFNSMPGGTFDVRPMLISLFVIILITFLSLRAKGILKTTAVILGVMIGWIVYYLWGLPGTVGTPSGSSAFFVLPEVFPWGLPTFDPGVTVSLVILSIVLIPNIVVSIVAMEKTIDCETSQKYYDRGLFVTGISDFLAGLIGAVGSIPFTISVGLVAISGVKERLPFIIGCIIFIIFGVFPVTGRIVATIPPPVVSAVLLVSASPLVVYALKDYASCKLDNRDAFVIGLSLLIGTGVMMLPGDIWRTIPTWAANIISNGIITGSLACIIMEHLVLRQRFTSVPDKSAVSR